uniref:Uncharacterized protein n=1 Tax=Anguilla anguilla TaxID=7936 RepID=A0A0E9U0T3_ANGAN
MRQFTVFSQRIFNFTFTSFQFVIAPKFLPIIAALPSLISSTPQGNLLIYATCF